MTPRTRTRRGGARALVVTTALAAVVGLGACSAVGDPSVAAAVDGETLVTQDEVATAVDELPLELTGGPVDPAQVLTLLAVGPTVAELAREEGILVGDVEARAYLAGIDEQAARATGSYSAPTLDLIATNLMLGELGQTQAAALVQERIGELSERLEVNPRYGQVAGAEEGLIVPAQHPWLSDGADGADGADG